MELGLILSILKFVSIGLSMAFGVLALLTKYRDDNGNITRWGRIALVGVFASGLAAAGAQSVEVALSNQARVAAENKTSAQLEANTRLLTDINRGLNPLSDVRATFWLRVSLDDPELQQGFVKRFTKSITPLIARWEADPWIESWADAYPDSREKGKVLSVTVKKDTSLFPQRATERFAYAAFKRSEIEMYFYRKPIEIQNLPRFGYLNSNSVEPDIDMSFEQDDKNPWDISLQYEPLTGAFHVKGSDILSKSKYWDSSGQIISLLDLAGAQVFITAESLIMSSDEPNRRIHPQVELVILDVGSRKGLRFRSAKLIAHKNPVDGAMIYEYRFPSSFDAVVADLH